MQPQMKKHSTDLMSPRSPWNAGIGAVGAPYAADLKEHWAPARSPRNLKAGFCLGLVHFHVGLLD
jgi:hypothetical protein